MLHWNGSSPLEEMEGNKPAVMRVDFRKSHEMFHRKRLVRTPMTTGTPWKIENTNEINPIRWKKWRCSQDFGVVRTAWK